MGYDMMLYRPRGLILFPAVESKATGFSSRGNRFQTFAVPRRLKPDSFVSLQWTG